MRMEDWHAYGELASTFEHPLTTKSLQIPEGKVEAGKPHALHHVGACSYTHLHIHYIYTSYTLHTHYIHTKKA
jgi:hypothetical protein